MLFLAVAAAVAAFFTYYHFATHPMARMAGSPAGGMDWLRSEFNLTDEQFAKVKAIHVAYEPKCGEMCMHIAGANSNLDRLILANKSVTPELVAALRQCARVKEECHEAMLGHLYAVAAEMSPSSGDRYLQMMKHLIIEPATGSNSAVSESEKNR